MDTLSNQFFIYFIKSIQMQWFSQILSKYHKFGSIALYSIFIKESYVIISNIYVANSAGPVNDIIISRDVTQLYYSESYMFFKPLMWSNGFCMVWNQNTSPDLFITQHSCLWSYLHPRPTVLCTILT